MTRTYMVALGLISILAFAPRLPAAKVEISDSAAKAGWSRAADGAVHKASGLRCPGSVLDLVAADERFLGDLEGTESEPFPSEASCIYQFYWNQGKPNQTRLIIAVRSVKDVPVFVKNWFSKTYKGEPALEHLDAGIALDARTVPSGKDVHVTTAFTRSEAHRTRLIRADHEACDVRSGADGRHSRRRVQTESVEAPRENTWSQILPEVL